MNERRFGRALLQQLGRRSVDIHMTETAFLMALDVDDTHSYFRISIFPLTKQKYLIVYYFRL
jgi:hypothetical protein